ncbi:unnamed protein product [Rotaria magnacalcarata]|nr:unnamed protein product [Rotaria magnacalcarata]
MDENGSVYVVDFGHHEVRRYRRVQLKGTVVASGNGTGNCLNQLYHPTCVFIDRDQSIYVFDTGNNRVMKWMQGATEALLWLVVKDEDIVLHNCHIPMELLSIN